MAGGERYLRFDPAACEPFVRLFDADTCWHLASVFPDLFIYLFIYLFFLGGRDLTTFSRFTTAELQPVALLYHRQVLLGFVYVASEDKVVSCTREILVFSHSLHSYGTFLF